MSILGLIVEYNPFHNGHLYHFNTSLGITQAEYCICAISGNFVQRGEPAIVDKWSRTLMALHAGADLVIEIPVIYCVQSAEFFAYGGVSILNSLGLVDTLCFGSEIGDIEVLKKIGLIISREPDSYKEYLKEEMRCGNPFAVSRSLAVCRYLMENSEVREDLSHIRETLQSSNNILGLEYIKWLQRLKSDITPLTIGRIHSDYNDHSLDSLMASATAIRKAISLDNMEGLKDQMPLFSLDILKKLFREGRGPIFMEDFCGAILCNLRRMSLDEISEIMDVNEGLQYRIKKAAINSGSLSSLVENIKTKRYTETRIKRILMHSLLGMKKSHLDEMRNAGGPQYIRVLGFSEKGRKLLSMMKETCPLPVIANTADYKKYDNPHLKSMIEQDILSTDIYVSCYKDPQLRRGGLDFYKRPETL